MPLPISLNAFWKKLETHLPSSSLLSHPLHDFTCFFLQRPTAASATCRGGKHRLSWHHPQGSITGKAPCRTTWESGAQGENPWENRRFYLKNPMVMTGWPQTELDTQASARSGPELDRSTHGTTASLPPLLTGSPPWAFGSWVRRGRGRRGSASWKQDLFPQIPVVTTGNLSGKLLNP